MPLGKGVYLQTGFILVDHFRPNIEKVENVPSKRTAPQSRRRRRFRRRLPT